MSRINGYDKTSDIVKNNKWDDPSVLELAKAYEDFANKGYFSEGIASNVWPAGQNQELAMGTAAMYLNGSWLPNELRTWPGTTSGGDASAIRQSRAEQTVRRQPTLAHRYWQSTRIPRMQRLRSS